MKNLFLFLLITISLDVTGQSPYSIQRLQGNLLPVENRGIITNMQSSIFRGKYYGVIQFYKTPSDADKVRLLKSGVVLEKYIGAHAFWGYSAQPNLEKLDLNIRSFSEWPAEQKTMRIRLDQKDNSIPEQYYLYFHANWKADDIASVLQDLGIKILAKHDPVLVSMNQSQFHEILKLPFVFAVDPKRKTGEPEDLGARALHNVESLRATNKSLNLDGSGVSIVVRDDGKIGPHIDYTGRVNDDYIAPGSVDFSHGDMVSGILMGAGNLDPDVTGAAPGSFLYLLEYQSEFTDETLMLHQDKGVTVSSSSYSDGCNNGYTTTTVGSDKMIYDYPNLIHVFSAGNSGTIDCGYGAGNEWGNITGGHKMGKNCIAVANVDPQSEIAESSSRGPASDGRIKPDISGNGLEQLSTYPNNIIDFGGGTSAAAPGVSGVLALLQQGYKQLHQDSIAPSALLKACILNAATEAGNPGPDFIYGWGIVNAKRAFDIIKSNQFYSEEISNSATKTHIINVPSGISKINVMVYWADKESVVGSAKALVNDIDMTVTSPSGGVALPWILNTAPDPILLQALATKGEDHLNNMEQISLQNPVPGNYTVNLSGYDIPFGPQKYYVVVSYEKNEINFTWPTGGESLDPKALYNIFWEAPVSSTAFTLESSTDMMNWTFVKTITASKRTTVWATPNATTSKIWLRLLRGAQTATTVGSISLIPRVDSMWIEQACVDSIRIAWNPVAGAQQYKLHQLTGNFMQSLASTNTNSIAIKNSDPSQSQWFSVVPILADGTEGRRRRAISSIGLVSCQYSKDITVRPNSFEANISKCEPFMLPVQAYVQNKGFETINGFVVILYKNLEIVNTQNINLVINPGDSVLVDFGSIALDVSEKLEISIEATIPNEIPVYDNVFAYELNADIQEALPFPKGMPESFESILFPPKSWILEESDNMVSWKQETVIGITGQLTKAAFLNNFANFEGSTDDLISPLYTVQSLNESALSFDYAYTGYPDFFDSLSIDISTDCGLTWPVNVFYDGGLSLNTVPSNLDTYYPASGADWKHIEIDMSALVGSDIRIRFRNISGFGNSMFLDNIFLGNLNLSFIQLQYPNSLLCELDTATFKVAIDQGLSYIWNFGANSIPSTATGAGPHSVVYSISGTKQVVLTADNQSIELGVTVSGQPNALFDYSIKAGQVFFKALNTLGSSSSWVFNNTNFAQGDSIAFNIPGNGSYEILHISSNACGIDSLLQIVELISVNDINKDRIKVFPNPSNGLLQVNGLKNNSNIVIFDMLGKPLLRISNQQESAIQIDLNDCQAGSYILKITEEQSGTSTIKLVIIK